MSEISFEATGRTYPETAGSPHTWDGLGFTDTQRRTMQAASVHLFDLLRATWERDPSWEGELLDRTIRFEGAFDNEGNVSTSVMDLDSGRSVSTAITKVS